MGFSSFYARNVLYLSKFYSPLGLATVKKHILDLRVTTCERIHERYALLRLTDTAAPLPPIRPGQFAQVRVDGAPGTFLRRPISVHFVDYARNEMSLLVQLVGEGTRKLSILAEGDTLNALLPLGNGFSPPSRKGERVLLVGGGVGVAPLLYLGHCLREGGCHPTFLLGARSEGDLLRLDAFGEEGEVYVTTEDGSRDERGFVTQHSLLRDGEFDRICCCGPKPMMEVVARYASERGTPCEVSLENTMACGLGACLCCVEETKRGNVCVCAEGPVFNIDELKWQTSE